MVQKILVLFFLAISLHGDDAWYSKFSAQIEAGVYMNEFGGDLSNSASVVDFADELGYEDTYASYFGLVIDNDYSYLPTLNISFINMKQDKDAVLNSNKKVVEKSDFNGSVNSKIDYSVINIALYGSLKQKGSMQRFLRWSFYTGDIEFNLGMNVKSINYQFQIRDMDDTTNTYHYVRVNTFVPLPYLGIRYYLYDLVVFANGSALSLADAKSTNYQAGLEYRVFENFYLGASYMYEDFEATEKEDKVNFQTSGGKFSFKYIF